ncbi:MAG TPA: S46 family peptidase [Chitinophagaceae bacterium]|nr:S46 family peptidase [Chitinophagaceae bacterium]
MPGLRSLLTGIFVFFSFIAMADEGMWIPLLLERMNEKEMKSLGMKISAKDIYNINKGSLKDAIVNFGGFCTGEVISSKGLVLTNHHCGFDAIQNHSTLDHNYIRDGYWAKNYGEELANPGLYVTFIVRIEDVSKQILNGVSPNLAENERQSIVDKNINELRKNIKKESYQDAFVRGFFEANQYYLFVTETYRDVRLVGAPPSSIGNFGKDTDNWIWPRHTGDFSMFRIYAGKDNKPADYSVDNVPYTPKRSLSISLDGASEGDFTMVFGFPGRTTEYLPAVAVQQIMEVSDPAKIAIRDKALGVIDGFMRKDEQIKIQYAEKYALVANAWKKWQGEVLGLTRTNAVDKKKMYEAEFQKRVNANPLWKNQYGNLLADLETAYSEFKPIGLARDYYLEITSRIELFTIASQLNSLRNTKNNGTKNAYSELLAKTKEKLADLYKEYSPLVDRNLFEVLMEMYVKDQDSKIVSPLVLEQLRATNNDFHKWTDQLYGGEELTAGNKVMAALEQNPAEFLERTKTDKACVLYNDIAATYNSAIAPKLNEIQGRINKLQRTYMQAQMEVMKEKKFYPDANSTLRVTYGKVKGYTAKDAVTYDYYSYLDGVMEKYVPGDYEFDVPKKLRELYNSKDYGQYGRNGKLPVCFIASNHTTGGNSGSPALDAWGNLIGLNFDRSWEGTMSDINYDPSICRNIMVDIRYVLFIIDKYAEAGWLTREMKLVHPKKK